MKSWTRISAMAAVHGRSSRPRAWAKWRHSAAASTPFPVPHPRSQKARPPSGPPPPPTASVAPYLSRSSVKSRSAISPYTITSVSSSGVPWGEGKGWVGSRRDGERSGGGGGHSRRARTRGAERETVAPDGARGRAAHLELLEHDELGDVRSNLLQEHLETLRRGGLRASLVAPRAKVETLRHAILQQTAKDLRLRALRRLRRGRLHHRGDERSRVVSRGSETTGREVVCRPRLGRAGEQIRVPWKPPRASKANAMTTLRCRPSGSARAPRGFLGLRQSALDGAPRHDVRARIRAAGRLRSRVRRPGRIRRPPAGWVRDGGGGRPRTEPTADDLERTMRTIHVAGIRGLRGQPGINPGEEITEDDLAQFFGNDGEVVGVRINGSNCWIEFADVNGAEVALLKDGTESGGHNLRVSRSKTPIRSNGYAAGRAKQQAALAAKQSPAGAATAAGAPMGTSMAAAAQQLHQSATRAPATQMSPAEIVDSINAALNEAIDAARIAEPSSPRSLPCPFRRPPPRRPPLPRRRS